MSSLIKPLFRLTVVAFMIAVLMPVTTGTDFCHKHEDHKKCQPPPPPPPPAPASTFTVTVFIVVPGMGEVNAVYKTGVVSKIHGNRQTLTETPVKVNISGLTLPGDNSCTPGFGTTDDAIFSFTTARIPPSEPDLTFVSGGFGGLMPVDLGESFALRFDNGSIDGPETVADWLPAPTKTTSLSGDTLSLIQAQSPTEAACNLVITQSWRIDVLGE